MRMGCWGGRKLSYQSVHLLPGHLIAYSGEFQVEGIERFVEAGQELAPVICYTRVYLEGIICSCCVARL